MAEKGKVWSERETRALLDIWCEGEIQRQLQGAVRNDLVYSRIVADLASAGTSVKSSSPRQHTPSSSPRMPNLPPSQPNERKTNEQNNDLHRSGHFTSHLRAINKSGQYDVIDRSSGLAM